MQRAEAVVYVAIEELEGWKERQRGRWVWCEDCLTTLPKDYAESEEHRLLHDEDATFGGRISRA